MKKAAIVIFLILSSFSYQNRDMNKILKLEQLKYEEKLIQIKAKNIRPLYWKDSLDLDRLMILQDSIYKLNTEIYGNKWYNKNNTL